ncbi:MAG: TIGR03564 family F420-dependent LLM class oxidoreductase [Thermomicrobia bacterium]|nr:TIGR03564 family F420-dependent LLM class oxidoreductase [Thermomicrobia bacterium]
MKIGVILPNPGVLLDLSTLLTEMARAEERGIQSIWVANVPRGFDALTLLALAGQHTRTVELGTFVVPTYPRHPVALAQQALTTNAATGGRLVLGIGLSHRVVMEQGLGFDWSHPIRHMREYLLCLSGFLAGEPVTFAGEEFHIANVGLSVPGATPPSILVAALGPQMLRLAGRHADGTALWMGGARYLAADAVPTITAAADEAGRPAPRIVAGLPVCVTDDADGARAEMDRAFAVYGRLPSYRAVLDKEGAAGPADVSLVGDEAAVLAGLRSLAQAGATDLVAAVYTPAGEDAARTYDLLERYIQTG